MPYESEFELEDLLAEPETDNCDQRLKGTSVAVVGGGLAGLMAARELARRGIKVTLFEARDQLGGRVRSNTTFSNGRITEEGAELIGSFHTTWLALARKYKLAMISRMDGHLYEREGLEERLVLGRPLSMTESWNLEKETAKRVLARISDAASKIKVESRPWEQKELRKFDDISVATVLEKKYKVDRNGPIWKQLEFQLVNNEVAPLEEMNFLGLLCKVRAAQKVHFRSDGKYAKLMRYWNELEIFRCADGCQKLATEIAKEIQNSYGSTVLLNTAVTHLDLSPQGVKLEFRQGIPGQKLVPWLPGVFTGDYVILAIPPSVWGGVRVKVNGNEWRPESYIGPQGMGPAVKYFTDLKERFWIKENAAPSGGSLTLGQVWEGTENETRVGNQGIVLSVFAGPILKGARVPTPAEFDLGLKQLYRGYAANVNNTLFTNWPKEPFIMTGYAAPAIGQIFKIGDKLTKPYKGRLFFAGEHTQMDFFGYMEGALRSGERAARTLIQQACGWRGRRVA
jgi:monoamine oxidase